MTQGLRVVVRNANGLQNHYNELTTFIKNNSIDLLLIPETHFTIKKTL